MRNSLRIGRIMHATTAEGPGIRTAVWVQGCSIRCAGCINPHLFDDRGGQPADPMGIVQEALAAGSEGITILGGEPFDQPDNCADLAEWAQRVGLGVITFTGYPYEHLVDRGSVTRRLIEATDLLVDGPYIAAQAEKSRSLVGSSNQRFIHRTDRYRDFDPLSRPNRVDMRVGPSGEIEIAGFLDAADLTRLASAIATRRGRRRNDS